ncbi:MAG: bifunctional methylenetetrahydrofolate dehydrogenase/methenyltetrahydrofolate cyclohydrolase, partial [Candidatus Pacebacteria bacterium]|nr:bifunctional methylenetetrahydrofolate dehydrogenase/methenyltetrahydrofolate cyclohydrolase [Candidatus Paceibacterota bacterium]
MIIDGKKIAEELKNSFKKEVALLNNVPNLVVVIVGKDSASKQFVDIKKRFANDVGIPIQLIYFPKETNTKTLVDVVKNLSTDNKVSGIVVQLPLPKHIDTQEVLNTVSVEKDIDVLSSIAVERFNKGESQILPPVVGAFDEILR